MPFYIYIFEQPSPALSVSGALGQTSKKGGKQFQINPSGGTKCNRTVERSVQKMHKHYATAGSPHQKLFVWLQCVWYTSRKRATKGKRERKKRIVLLIFWHRFRSNSCFRMFEISLVFVLVLHCPLCIYTHTHTRSRVCSIQFPLGRESLITFTRRTCTHTQFYNE